MIVVIAVAAILVIGLAVALASGALARLSVHRTESVSSAGGHLLPPGRIVSDDVEGVRFDVALRGYRMDQVDETVERLRQRLAEFEAEDVERRGGLPMTDAPAAGLGGSVTVFPRREVDDSVDATTPGEASTETVVRPGRRWGRAPRNGGQEGPDR